MKRIFMALLASAALFASCMKDNTDVQDGGQTALIPVRFTVDQVATRVSGTAFEVGDQVGMFITKTGEQAPYVDNVKFTVTESGVLEPESPVYYPADRSRVSVVAYYPYSDGGKTVLDVDLAADQSKEIADASMYRAEQGVTPSTAAVALNFTPALAIVKLYVYNATFDESEMKISFTAAVKGAIDLATGECSYDGTANVKPCPAGDHYEVVVLPQTLAAGSKITVASTEEKYDFTLSNDFVLTAGTANDVELNLDPNPAEVIDLSANGTANCYIVNKPGMTYCFRADIMGNGASTENITPEKLAPVKARLLKTHVADANYKGGTTYGSDGTMSKLILKSSVSLVMRRGIPYIYFTTPEQLAAGNAIIAATDEAGNVLWSWHMWCTPDYELGQGDVTITANANSNGVVMMDRNLGALSKGYGDADYTNEQNAYAASGLVYQFGRKDPFLLTNPGKWTYGNYQYPDGTVTEVQGASRKQILEADGTTKTWTNSAVPLNSQTAPTVKDAIKFAIANPEIYCKGYDDKYVNTWSTDNTASNPIAYLWGNTNGSMDANAGVKTIYDPCPVGYKVPGPRAFAFWNQAGSNMAAVYHYGNLERYNFDQTKTKVTVSGTSVSFDCSESFGYYMYTAGVLEDGQTDADRTDKTTVFFPALGIVSYAAGQAISVGELSMMTNSIAANNTGYRSAYITTKGSIYFSEVGSYYGWPATALAVRCIKE